MKKYRYRGFVIQPKRDFPPGGYLSNGKRITKGWVVGKTEGLNSMPGATWFGAVPEAKNAIDVFIKVRGNADKFWEIMQPFGYKVGQCVDTDGTPLRGDSTVSKGRWSAIIENGVVTKVTKVSWKEYAKTRIY